MTLTIPKYGNVFIEPLTGRGRAAVFSIGFAYRYFLQIPIAKNIEVGHNGVAAFCMLNPSTATSTKDDATSRKCIAWAEHHLYAWVVLVNRAAFRATDPKELFKERDPIGLSNEAYVGHALKLTKDNGCFICAWGAHGAKLPRLACLDKAEWLYCFGTTKGGEPRHPLYMKKSTLVSIWSK